jgi:hypothetical protein
LVILYEWYCSYKYAKRKSGVLLTPMRTTAA